MTYELKVTDDEPVDCSRVTVTYVLGHDTHGHPQSTATGCSGSLTTTVPGGHDPATDDLSAVFVAQYTDTGSQPASHRFGPRSSSRRPADPHIGGPGSTPGPPLVVHRNLGWFTAAGGSPRRRTCVDRRAKVDWLVDVTPVTCLRC